MQILVATYSGFCEGVAKAFNTAQALADGNDVFMLGDLVHNSEVVKKLKEQGISTVKSIDEIPASTSEKHNTVIISAHGVGPQIYKSAKEKNLNIVDTTCPWVKRAQSLAEKASLAGHTVVIVGDKGHPEVKGIKEWADPHSIIVENENEAKQVKAKGEIEIISQTTQSEEKFASLAAIIESQNKNVIIHDTICSATGKRQQSVIELAADVDVMLIVGDKKSANTMRLYELSLERQPNTYWIQTADELNLQWIGKADKVGVSAGASTPEWTVDSVIKKINANK